MIKKIILLSALAASLHIYSQKYEWETATSNGYTYKYVSDDPTQARYYTLKNGLTVILSSSKKEPRIQAYIAVKAGSKTDPANNTGLAHYLEHMIFKGTDKYGTLDWSKEKPLLDKISALYETYHQTTDDAKRKEIYRQIDKVSGEAAKYAIANEYDKMMANMGAQGTNAFTSFEQTVYTDDVPANALDKYLAVQAERFRKPVLRIFHTELEAVYEEKNRGLDNDGRKTFEAMFASLFPENNYGKQTTIGIVEHLKNPSLVEIQKYYDTYYVPNNMGIIMSGDFNPDEVIAKIDKAFSYMKPKSIPQYNPGNGYQLNHVIEKEVWGPNPESIMMGYRFPGASSKDAQLLEVVGDMLTNGQAGLIDLDLVKKQKLLSAYAFAYPLKDYSVLLLQGNPVEGQSLNDVKNLLLQEINKLKKGDFSEDLLKAIVNNRKKSFIQASENYTSRANELMEEFTSELDRKSTLEVIENISKLTKKDIINFANKYFKDNNYAIVYKRKGEDKNIKKVEKPSITPVEVNREAESPFLKQINNMPEKAIQPVWVNYNQDIEKGKLGDAEVLSVKNKDNALFRLYYYFNSGKWDNKLLPIAASYLEFLGTKKKSSDDISKAFYQLASSFSVNTGNEETAIALEGLDENFSSTVQLFEDFIRNCVADPQALEAYKARLKKARENTKQNKAAIMQGLRSYALYGAQNPFNYVLSDAELDAIKAEDLTKILHELLDSQHKVLYYGPKSNSELISVLKDTHRIKKALKPIAKGMVFTQTSSNENKVLFAHYDMVQAEVNWVRNTSPYQVDTTPTISLFNEYFGGGMGSIVFQTIRESKALAYSTNARYYTPSKAIDKDYFTAYVGTQADKFVEATSAMNELLSQLPESEKLFNIAKTGLIKNLASERITQDGIIFNYLRAQKLNLNSDVRKLIFEKVPQLQLKDLVQFHQTEISKKPYTYCIVADQTKVNQEELKKLGKLQTLSLEEIFGY